MPCSQAQWHQRQARQFLCNQYKHLPSRLPSLCQIILAVVRAISSSSISNARTLTWFTTHRRLLPEESASTTIKRVSGCAIRCTEWVFMIRIRIPSALAGKPDSIHWRSITKLLRISSAKMCIRILPRISITLPTWKSPRSRLRSKPISTQSKKSLIHPRKTGACLLLINRNNNSNHCHNFLSS